MIKVKHIDHVAIAVPDLDGAAAAYAGLFSLSAGAREDVPSQGARVAFLHAGGTADRETALELVCPASSGGGLDRFLSRRGTALHHVCFAVDDLAGALATLKAAGVSLIDEAPRPGARGHQVAFIDPKATGGVLFELCERRPA